MPSVTRKPADAGSTVRVEHGDCPGRMSVVGYVPKALRRRSDCDQPLLRVCDEGCGWSDQIRCRCSSSDKCGPCAERNQKELAQVVARGINQRIGAAGYLYFLTVTAPGTKAGHRRWFQGKRPAGGTPQCDCDTVWAWHSLGSWNRQESANWNRLRTALGRHVGGKTAYISAVEPQKRGALHRHIVVASPRPLIHTEVQGLALAAGYGCVLDLEPLQSPEKAARYLSKYVTKTANERAEVPWQVVVVNERTGEVYTRGDRATYRAWSSSQDWGCTRKLLREEARTQAQARAAYLRALTPVSVLAASETGPEGQGSLDPPEP